MAVRAFQVTTLTETEYEDREISAKRILEGSGKGWNRTGMHHVDAHRLEDGSWLACVDGWAPGGLRSSD
jgi:hypothetical protein